MAKYTSWKVGGPARHFYRPADADDLVEFLRSLPADEKLLWLGLGSNLLVRDGGFDGTVVHTQGCLKDMLMTGPTSLRIEAGVSCAVAARYAAREGLVGLEFFAGIPGTVGGALSMNAGSFGGETWPLVESVEMINRHGDIVTRQPEEFVVAYRQVELPEADEWFLSANFRLQQGDAEQAQEHIRQLLQQRADSQPIGLPSGGSTFRNPPGDHAARLIESCGLKGHCIGDACVSEKHANFVINTDDASAADIEQLIRLIQQTVLQQTGVELQPEVRIVGEEKAA
jgi:UDP-N-acetylmuramate dehydrogenase